MASKICTGTDRRRLLAVTATEQTEEFGIGNFTLLIESMIILASTHLILILSKHFSCLTKRSP